MTISLQDFLNQILTEQGPAGLEYNVTKRFANYISPYVSEVKTDIMGNLIAHVKGEGKRKVMLMAHADEIGLMINYIDDNGYLYFKCIGGVDTSILPSRRVSISGKNSNVIGVIGKKPIHIEQGSSLTVPLPEDLWIDIGAKNRVEAESLVSIGDCATFLSDPITMQNNLLISKSLDDRVGLAVLAGVAQRLKGIKLKADLYLVASVQEEIGARGAQVASAMILPDEGIAIDVAHATDYPTMSPIRDGDIKLGEGVVIPVGPNISKKIYTSFSSIAQYNNIKHQRLAIPSATPSDARIIQLAGIGVETSLLCIPCRYMHTPNEVISIDDICSTISLIVEYLRAYS